MEITDSSNEDSGSASEQQCPELHDPHVMISYQWDSQEQMIAVKEMLIAEGYNVWMDVDKMGKYTMEYELQIYFIIFEIVLS